MQLIEGDQSEQFVLLPKIRRYIQEQYEYSITNFELYYRLFIAPGAIQRSFGINLRHSIAIDAMYTTPCK